MKAEDYRNAKLDSYVSIRDLKRAKTERQDNHDAIMVHYREERKKEATLRMVSFIRPAADYGGRKLEAYSKSCYAEEILKNKVEATVSMEQDKLIKEKQRKETRSLRKAFLRMRIADRGPSGFGSRSELSIPSTKSLAKVSFGRDASYETLVDKTLKTNPLQKPAVTDSAIDCSRSRGMKLLFQDELDEIVAQEAQEWTHRFDKRNLGLRLKEFNSDVKAGRGAYKAFQCPPSVMSTAALLGQLEDDEDEFRASERRVQLKSVKNRRKSMETVVLTHMRTLAGVVDSN